MEILKYIYCKTDPGIDKTGRWSGFRDQDTQELVCWRCRYRHYKTKFAIPRLFGLYSELPVTNFTPDPQLKIKL